MQEVWRYGITALDDARLEPGRSYDAVMALDERRIRQVQLGDVVDYLPVAD